MSKFLAVKRYPILIGFLIFSVQGCSIFSSVSYYDPTTYRNLIELKVYTMFLYETLSDDSLDLKEVRNIRIRLAMAYEYEKGKGEQNNETAQQIKTIQEMFDKHIDDRKAKGRWSVSHLNNQLENIMEAYDIARKTELLKNKPK
jgi:hypothetical protein